MKFNLKGLNLNMLLLVAILVGVLVVFLRQNNKCMMDEDVEEGFDEFAKIKLKNRVIKNKNEAPFERQRAGLNLQRAVNNCRDKRDCFGVQEIENVIDIGPFGKYRYKTFQFVKGDNTERKLFKDSFDKYFEPKKNHHFYNIHRYS